MLQRSARVRWLVGLALVMFSACGPWLGPQTEAARPQRYPFSDPSPAAQVPTGDSIVYLPIVMANGSIVGQASFTRAFSDSRSVKSEAEYVTYFQTFRTILCSLDGIPPQSLTPAQAKANLRSLVVSQVGSPAVDAYLSAINARPASERATYAAQALAAHAPTAALLAFLAESDGELSNSLPLVSAAGLANVLDRPNEALALLDAAGALGMQIPAPVNIKGRALALNNRGYALQAIGRWADSEAYLRQAVSAEPLLAEAKLNLARALACQNKDQEAAKVLRAGLQRQPGVPPFNMTKGQNPQLPFLPFPQSYRNVPAAIPVFQAIEAADQGRENARLDRISQLSSQLFGPGPVFEPHSMATVQRTTDVLHAADVAQIRPDLSELYQTVRSLQGEPMQVYRQTLERLITEPEQAAYGVTPYPEYVRVWRAKCAEVIREQHPKWLSAMTALDSAKRAYIQAAYPYRTALVANLANPYAHEAGYLGAQQEADSLLHDGLASDVSFYLRLVNNADGALTNDPNSQCWGDTGLPSEQEGASAYQDPPACPDEWAGDSKLLFNFPSLMSISMNCEQIEVMISGELLAPFAQVTYKRGGEWTIFGGIKGELPGLPVEAKTGFYIRGNGAGDITDGGFKSSAAANLKVIEYEPFEFEAGVASAYEYLTSSVYN